MKRRERTDVESENGKTKQRGTAVESMKRKGTHGPRQGKGREEENEDEGKAGKGKTNEERERRRKNKAMKRIRTNQ